MSASGRLLTSLGSISVTARRRRSRRRISDSTHILIHHLERKLHYVFPSFSCFWWGGGGRRGRNHNFVHYSISKLSEMLFLKKKGKELSRSVCALPMTLCRKEPDLELEGLLKRHSTTVKFFQGSMMNAVDLARVKVVAIRWSRTEQTKPTSRTVTYTTACLSPDSLSISVSLSLFLIYLFDSSFLLFSYTINTFIYTDWLVWLMLELLFFPFYFSFLGMTYQPIFFLTCLHSLAAETVAKIECQKTKQKKQVLMRAGCVLPW